MRIITRPKSISYSSFKRAETEQFSETGLDTDTITNMSNMESSHNIKS